MLNVHGFYKSSCVIWLFLSSPTNVETQFPCWLMCKVDISLFFICVEWKINSSLNYPVCQTLTQFSFGLGKPMNTDNEHMYGVQMHVKSSINLGNYQLNITYGIWIDTIG